MQCVLQSAGHTTLGVYPSCAFLFKTVFRCNCSSKMKICIARFEVFIPYLLYLSSSFSSSVTHYVLQVPSRPHLRKGSVSTPAPEADKRDLQFRLGVPYNTNRYTRVGPGQNQDVSKFRRRLVLADAVCAGRGDNAVARDDTERPTLRIRLVLTYAVCV
ncbi:hypothetical protein EVAR_50800_1 [Eumeta japonica]|uniref:Uncharacterized protein n=1 Tax=Eumeta variegata TaxID=151549 RepID=A0A4C1XEM1_EUMVA|nr:hypothetical protein EVAR_50800_1 [Eumeta japonica]